VNYLISSIIIILGTIGLERIITKSRIIRPLREWLTLKNESLGYILSCSQCVGFWSAFFVYLCFKYELHFVIYALIGSFVCELAYKLIKKLD
jgi:hypothetical protein